MTGALFQWEKLGLVWGPSKQAEWMNNSCLTPTPIFLKSQNVIRVFSSLRDKDGVGRIGYTDVSPSDPTKVLSYATKPVLDIGRQGAFDDNGVILGDFMIKNNELYMYYVGFQLVEKAKFLAFTGCAQGNKEANAFIRLSEAPVLDRDSSSIYINAIHTASFDERLGKIYAWTGSGNGWNYINGRPYPSYVIRKFTSYDGLHFQPEKTTGIDFEGTEYRIGRPRVYSTKQGYIMFYTKGTETGEYICECAVSNDGADWRRDKNGIGITTSTEGWDSKHLCYPVLLRVRSKIFMFYNGNNMGVDGFGVAELKEGGDIFADFDSNLDKVW